jgi:hypothetical protein
VSKSRGVSYARSKVAHGRYEEGVLGYQREREIRRDFEDLVCRVAKRFQVEGSEHSWTRDQDLREWQDRLEMA